MVGLLCAFPWVVRGQALSQDGGEFAIGRSLRGDQMNPALSLSATGGYLAWQDNVIDRDGQGVGAQRLGADFAPVMSGRRVNQITAGNQRLPQVARLTDGGQVFVWEAGRADFPGVYARFMGPLGAFLTPDIKVNRSSYSATNQITTNWIAWRNGVLTNRQFTFTQAITEFREAARDPAVTCLQDGNVVVAYTCYRKVWSSSSDLVNIAKLYAGQEVMHSKLQPTSGYLDSMQDVLIRRVAPTGKRLGKDVVVNEFLPYNQRNPALALLNNGNFVVVWVSERQIPTTPTQPALVDIEARVFNPLGQPLGPEFRVNATRGLCGEPAVSALGPDGFTVVWTQFDLAGSGGWDVYGRVLSASDPAAPEPTTSAFLVNTYQRNRQSHPRIATAGANQLIVWTSMGQDGWYEGVFGRLLSRGELAGEEFRVNTRTISRQIQPCVASDGENRFLVVWSSFVSGTTGFDVIGQAFVTTLPPAAPAAPVVAALGCDRLEVSWLAAPYPNVESYQVYMDGAATPVLVTNNSWVAEGLAPISTHEFRVAYVLTDGQYSDRSPPGVGTTLDKEDPVLPAQASPALAGTASPGAEAVTGVASGEAGLRLGINVSPLGRRLHWNTQAGAVYQVQSSTNLSGWSDVGAPRVAGGADDSLDVTNKQSAAFFRVIRLR